MAPTSRRPRSALYALNAYGITNPWIVWSIHAGNLTELCRGCNGRGIIARRPCPCTERGPQGVRGACPVRCTGAAPCSCCRVRCPDCYGRRASRDSVYAEDFGDAESRAIALRLFDVEVDPHLRSDMEAAALG